MIAFFFFFEVVKVALYGRGGEVGYVEIMMSDRLISHGFSSLNQLS